MSKPPFHGEIQDDRQRHRPATFRQQLPVLLGEMAGFCRQDEIAREVASVMTIRNTNDRTLVFENPQMMDDATQRYAEDSRKLAQVDPRLGRNRLEGTLSNVCLWTVGTVTASGALRHK